MGIATCFLSRDGYTKGHQDQGKGNGTEGGDVLKVYLDLVVLLNFAVNYGLLRATAQLTGARAAPWRLGAGAGIGAVYAGACVLPGLGFLAGNLWRVVFLGLMVAAAFGFGRQQLRQGLLFWVSVWP